MKKIILLIMLVTLSFSEDTMEKFYKGFNYFHGLNGVKKDYDKAFPFFEQASNEGNKNAMYYLANMYYNGLGTPSNRDKYIELTRYLTQNDKFIK